MSSTVVDGHHMANLPQVLDGLLSMKSDVRHLPHLHGQIPVVSSILHETLATDIEYRIDALKNGDTP